MKKDQIIKIFNKYCIVINKDYEEYIIRNKNAFINELSTLESEPEEGEYFKRPTDKEIIEIALLFNDGKIQRNKLRDMVAMTDFILDRLYENGNINQKSSKE